MQLSEVHTIFVTKSFLSTLTTGNSPQLFRLAFMLVCGIVKTLFMYQWGPLESSNVLPQEISIFQQTTV